MNKKIMLVFLILGLVVLFIPLVNASYVCPAAFENTSSLSGTYFYHQYPYAGGSVSSIGMAFTANSTCYLYNSELWCRLVNSFTGTMTSRLFAVSGTVGTDAVPAGSVLDSSSAVDVTTIGSVDEWVIFTFSGTYELQQGEDYIIVWEMTSSSGGDPTHCVAYGSKVGSSNLNKAFFASSVWSFNGADIPFVINGDTVPFMNPTATPTPSPSPSPSLVSVTPSAAVVAVPSYYMVVLVLFAVVAVLAGIYVGFERDGGNKGVAFLFALVALVIFVVLIVGYLTG